VIVFSRFLPPCPVSLSLGLLPMVALSRILPFSFPQLSFSVVSLQLLGAHFLFPMFPCSLNFFFFPIAPLDASRFFFTFLTLFCGLRPSIFLPVFFVNITRFPPPTLFPFPRPFGLKTLPFAPQTKPLTVEITILLLGTRLRGPPKRGPPTLGGSPLLGSPLPPRPPLAAPPPCVCFAVVFGLFFLPAFFVQFSPSGEHRTWWLFPVAKQPLLQGTPPFSASSIPEPVQKLSSFRAHLPPSPIPLLPAPCKTFDPTLGILLLFFFAGRLIPIPRSLVGARQFASRFPWFTPPHLDFPSNGFRPHFFRIPSSVLVVSVFYPLPGVHPLFDPNGLGKLSLGAPPGPLFLILLSDPFRTFFWVLIWASILSEGPPSSSLHLFALSSF